ncbi:MAG: hypothetical protein ACR2M4_00605 [Actinomycetota bacterium]
MSTNPSRGTGKVTLPGKPSDTPQMKQLLDSCRDNAPRAWKTMAREKIDELDGTIQRATAMKQLLARWIDCNCVSLEDCRLIADRLKITATGR